MKEAQNNKKRQEILEKLKDPKEFQNPYFNPQQVHLRAYQISAKDVINNQSTDAFNFDNRIDNEQVDRFAQAIFGQRPVYNWKKAGLGHEKIIELMKKQHKQPPTAADFNLMDQAENEKSFINLFIDGKEPETAFNKLRSFNFMQRTLLARICPSIGYKQSIQ